MTDIRERLSVQIEKNWTGPYTQSAGEPHNFNVKEGFDFRPSCCSCPCCRYEQKKNGATARIPKVFRRRIRRML